MGRICKIVAAFALDESAHESAVVVQLCGAKHSRLCKDAEQATSKLTRY